MNYYNNGRNNDDQNERERINESGGEPRRGTPDPGPMKKK